MRPVRWFVLSLALLCPCAAAKTKDPAALVEKARAAFEAGDHEKAIALAGEAIGAAPREARWWNLRGSLRFRAGAVAGSLADFNAAIELRPDLAPHHWKRGISLYEVGRYEAGRRQFEAHRKVNPDDVENAAWHFLCVAAVEGPEKAEAALLPVKKDSRVPMMPLYRMYAGEVPPEAVLEVVSARKPPERVRREWLFYAHLYIGLYHEAWNRPKQADKHLRLAAEEYRVSHYMGDVAQVHWARRCAKRSAEDGSGASTDR